MKKIILLLTLAIFAAFGVNAQKFTYSDSWGKAGFNLLESKSNAVQVVFSVPEFSLDDVTVNGQNMKNVILPGTFLFNDQGKPNLPGKGNYIAIPTGATPKLTIVSQRTEIFHNVEISPAPRIPLDLEDGPLDYSKDMTVYSKNALFPESPVQISEIQQIRGVDVVILGITPFQYNPVTKDLIVYKDLKVELSFEGGNGQFGDQAFRSRWWDPIMNDNILNHASLPVVDYNARYAAAYNTELDECEYIIITPTGTDFLSWADSIKKFRTEQGILTEIFTLTEVGGNTVAAIEAFINNAYDNWTIKPAACLLLGDYGTDETKNIISHMYSHPASYPNYASDNKYADVTGDEMPDVIFSRITANNATQLQVMVTKMLNYERTPPTNPRFYNKPITALGWQTERWFQLCSEIVGGYFRLVKGKEPRRINKIYQGTPGSVWSTAQNTNTIVSYFGPSGLNYIPQSPSTLGSWDGGNAAQINQAIDSGAFMLQHRDHGEYLGWGEPSYKIANIQSLTNTDLTFIFSINCQTGAYHRSSECFSENFHRFFKNGHNSGALGVVSPSEVSYSFVNDTFVWGMYDNMWPDFMPAEGTTPPSRGALPAFGNAAGKYFLKQSNWPYNGGDKLVTYRLFHMFGDAFQTLYYEVPQPLTVVHDPTIQFGATSFSVQANSNSLIALSANGEILATGLGNSVNPTILTIPVLPGGTNVIVTVTLENYYRYKSIVPVIENVLSANFSANVTSICAGSSVSFTDNSSGNPTAWAWTFDGGTPATSTDQNPTGIVFANSGSHTVSLTVTKDANTNTLIRDGYIQTYNYPEAAFGATQACIGNPTVYADQTNPNGGTITKWMWIFGEPASGVNDTSYDQNPSHTYATAGTFNVKLIVTNNSLCEDEIVNQVVVNDIPGIAATPIGDAEPCQGATLVSYTTTGAQFGDTYTWEITPSTAGTVTGTLAAVTVDFAPDFKDAATLKVKALNSCGEGPFSQEFAITVRPLPGIPEQPAGPDSVNLNVISQTDFTIAAAPDAIHYGWTLEPAAAGTIAGDLLTGTATWNNTFTGYATIAVKSMNECGESVTSTGKTLKLYAPVGISENNGLGLELYPNPSQGKFTVSLSCKGDINATLTIFNAIGSPVYTESNIKISDKFNKTINLNNMSEGVYYIKIESNSGSIIRKLVIQR